MTSTIIKSIYSSFAQEGGVGVQIASDGSRHQQRLHMGDEADGDLLLQVRVHDLFALPVLPGGQDGLAGLAFIDAAVRSSQTST